MLCLMEARLEEVLVEVGRVRLPEMLPPGLQHFWHYHFNAESVAFENFFFAVGHYRSSHQQQGH